MNFLVTFIRVVDRLNKVIALATSILMPAMVVVMTFEVVSRYIFNRPTLWAYDTSIFIFGYCGLLAAPYVLRIKGHINVDIVYSRLSPRTKAIFDSVTKLLIFFLLILVVVYGWKYALTSLAMKERTASEWGPPVGHFKLIVPIGAFLLLLQGIADWIRDLYRAITDKELEA